MADGFKRRLQVMRPAGRWRFGMAGQGEHRTARGMGVDCARWISPESVPPPFFLHHRHRQT